ncbi:MAG: sugar ABC transporter substrate-binding protein [Solirubrobacterales bacterium]
MACALLALVVAACGGSGGGTSSGSTEASGASTEASSEGGGSVEGKTATIVGCYSAIPYCAKENEVMKAGLEEAGVKVTLLLDELTAPEEAAHISQGVAAGTDIILWVANAQEAAHAPLVKAQQADIPVILVGTAASETVEGLYTTYIGPDDVVSGELQAKMLVEGLEAAGTKSGKVMLVTGAVGPPTVANRIEGFNKEIANYPQYELAAEPDGMWDPVKAAQVTQPLFAKYGDEMVGATAFSGAMGAAVAETAAQAGLSPGTEKGDVVIAAINCDGTSIQAIKDGTMYATTSQGPVEESEIAVQTAIELLEGAEVPANIPIPNEPITKENVAEYAAECNY